MNENSSAEDHPKAVDSEVVAIQHGPLYDYAIHPLAALFPLLPEDRFAELEQDIKEHGQVEPITLDCTGKIVLDGRRRLEACKRLGIDPKVDLYGGLPENEADFIWSKNIHRRHLSEDQRAIVASKWADEIRKLAKERQRA